MVKNIQARFPDRIACGEEIYKTCFLKQRSQLGHDLLVSSMIDKYLQRFELVKVIRVVVYFFSTKPDISTQLVAIIKPVLFSYDN